MAVLFKVIKRAGPYFKYESDTSDALQWLGRDPMVEAIRSNLELKEEISAKTLAIATNKE